MTPTTATSATATSTTATGATMTSTTTLLAFDFGMTHIGVAVGQTITSTATPLREVRARHGVPDWPAIEQCLAEWRPTLLLVGLPLNMDDTDNHITTRARRFARQLHGRSTLPTLLVDERLTSVAARERLRAGRHHPDYHGVAAQLIAESWLHAPQHNWPDANARPPAGAPSA